jgi:phosphatidylethanolamine/phosphatidyl-N-methylethanolamine N-methyltransferase
MRMTEEATSPLYDLWAKFYDYTFGALVRNRQTRALQQLRPSAGDTVLDIGVGTGMTLKHYRKDITVVGMDLSAGMLAKARKKIQRDGMHHCVLVQGDAMAPPFADHSFDHVMITHVVSVVSDPQKLMRWAQRMVKPGGRVVVLNHFLSTNPFLAWWEKILNPIFVKIGWHSDLALEDCLKGTDLTVQYNFKMHYLDLWQIVVLGDQTPGESRGYSSKPSPELPRQAEPTAAPSGDGPAGKSHAALAMD